MYAKPDAVCIAAFGGLVTTSVCTVCANGAFTGRKHGIYASQTRHLRVVNRPFAESGRQGCGTEGPAFAEEKERRADFYGSSVKCIDAALCSRMKRLAGTA